MPLTLTKEIKDTIQFALLHCGAIEQLSANSESNGYVKLFEAGNWIEEQEVGAVPLAAMREGLNVVMELFREEEMEDDDFEPDN